MVRQSSLALLVNFMMIRTYGFVEVSDTPTGANENVNMTHSRFIYFQIQVAQRTPGDYFNQIHKRGMTVSEIEKNKLIRKKLSGLVHSLKEATDLLVILSRKRLSTDDMRAVGELNDRCALYLQEIMLLLSKDQSYNVVSTLDFVDQVEYLVHEIKSIDEHTGA